MVDTRVGSGTGRLVGLIRGIALSGLAGAIAGVLVLGVGGRLVMFVSRLLHPEAMGRMTEGGNRIGEFTLEGTIALLVFVGLGFGLLGGVIWVLVREWIPRKASIVGAGAVGIGGTFVIDGDNIDFFILEGPFLDVILLLGLVFLFGVTVFRIDAMLDARMRDRPRTLGIVVYSVMVALAAPLLIPTFGNFFDEDFCFCTHPPIWTGVFLASAAVATVTWWFQHLRGAENPSRRLSFVGRTSVALCAAAGAIDLATEIALIF